MARPSPSRSSPSAMCPSAMLLLFSASASRSDSSSTFFARGVNGMWPPRPRPRRGGVERARSEGRLHAVPDGVQVDAERAERRRRRGRRADVADADCRRRSTPGSGRGGPGRRRSGCPGRAGRAAGARCRCGRDAGGGPPPAPDDDLPGLLGEPFEHRSVPPPERPAAARVLLVHCLPGDAQELGDLLPRPALVAGVADLEVLEPLHQRPQRPDRLQPDGGVPAAGSGWPPASCPPWLST